MLETDVVIIGAGIGGLSTALYLQQICPGKKVLILDKEDGLSSNTNFAQGGMAAVFDLELDSFESHIRDTLEAGKYNNDPLVVEYVISSAPGVVKDLVDWGVRFDVDALNKFELGLEGGHSFPRIVHHKDQTGARVLEVLREKIRQFPNIEFLTYYTAFDIWIEEDKCKGIHVYHPQHKEITTIPSQFLIIATGGSGQIFEATSNPSSATGDGLAMAIKVGAQVVDLEYYQFHPTALFAPGVERNFLITEAIRGAGASIINNLGRRFLFDKDPRAELATRDKVTSWIFEEMAKTKSDHVFLDARHLGDEKLKNSFPMVYENCLTAAFDLAKTPVPIVPAAHYQCGGIKVDLQGKTSVTNLYAVGECAHTGLHGSNRLASNSLPEAMVFAKNIAIDIGNQSWNHHTNTYTNKTIDIVDFPSVEDLQRINSGIVNLKSLMSEAFLKKIPQNRIYQSQHSITKECQWVESKIEKGILDSSILKYRNMLRVANAMLKAKYSHIKQ